MLKERDKKLLFYSWSYGILAAALIYTCMGCGVMAAYTQQWTGTQSSSGSIEESYGWFAYWIMQDSSEIADHSITKITMSATPGGFKWNTACPSSLTGSYYNGEDYYISNKSGYHASHGGVDWAYTCDHLGSYGDDTAVWTIYIDNPEGLRTIPDGSHINVYRTSDNHVMGSTQTDWGRASTTGYSVWGSHTDDLSAGGLPSARWVGGGTPMHHYVGTFTTYSGTALTAPVINNFTADASCYAPAEAIVLESDVTGDVDDWYWEIYDSDDNPVWSSNDSVETIVDEVFDPGLYQVQLTVENGAGSDFLSKEDWLNITLAGGCGPVSNWSNPFPTQVTTVPTQQFYETMTMPPHIVTNMTGINEEINKGMFANMSQGYRDYFDYIGEQANTTFTGTFRTLLSPVSLVINAIAYAISLFSTSINALTVYTTVPLAITAIVINYMPWQIVTLITAGIAIDAILIIILGR